MMKSIMHRKNTYCYLCSILHDDFAYKTNMQEHHAIYGNGRRRLSEKYGLKVYLCEKHHLHGTGPEAVHENAEVSMIVKKAAQLAFMYRFPDLDFREIFGKSYLSKEDMIYKKRSRDPIIKDPAGFQIIEESDSFCQDRSAEHGSDNKGGAWEGGRQ